MDNLKITYSMKSESIGSGRPIVLVPGGLTGWISWEPHSKILSNDYRVTRVQLLAVDLGLEDKPLPKGYSFKLESDALLNAINKEGILQADFVAWSYGAEVTLNFALDNPDKIRTLTLIEPPAIWVLRSRGPLSKEMVEDQKKLQLLGPGDISEEQLVWFSHFAGFVPSDKNPRELPQWPVWVKYRQSLRTGDAVFLENDYIKKVRSFKKPVLLFKGVGSPKFLTEIIDILGQEFPDATVKELPGAHALHIVSINQFIDILIKFLKKENN